MGEPLQPGMNRNTPLEATEKLYAAQSVPVTRFSGYNWVSVVPATFHTPLLDILARNWPGAKPLMNSGWLAGVLLRTLVSMWRADTEKSAPGTLKPSICT